MFLVASKVFWFLADPANLLVLVLCVGAALGWTRRWRRLGRRLVTLAALGFLVVAALPVGVWLTTAIENRFPAVRELPERVDGIVVLGGITQPTPTAARGVAVLNEGGERLTTFVALARRFPEAKLVFTGGTSALFGATLKEADVAEMLLTDLGFELERVVFERDSRNTYENAILTRKLAHPRQDETWVLITSALHMPRAVGTFRRAGWNVVPYPVDYRTEGRFALTVDFKVIGGLRLVADSVHELMGLVIYRLVDRTDSLFPGPVHL